jgi:hypothetical protein
MAWFRAVVATTVMTMLCGLLAGGAARAEALQFRFLGSSSDQHTEGLPHPQALEQDIARPGRNLSGGLTGATRMVQMTQPVRPSIVIRPVPGSEAVSDSDLPEPLPPSPEEAAAERAVEVAYWDTARESGDPVMLRAYLDRYPDGEFSELARLMLEQLEREEATGPDREPVADERRVQEGRASADSPSAADSRELLADIQGQLARHGCNPGPADGIWGPRSQRALDRAAQRQEIPSRPTPQLLSRLQEVEGPLCPQTRQASPRRPTAQTPTARRAPAPSTAAAQPPRPAPPQPAAQPPQRAPLSGICGAGPTGHQAYSRDPQFRGVCN